MRLTVGPLPSAVYWRRRAVVLGAIILLLVVLLYSCSRSENTAGPDGGASPSAPAPGESVTTPQTGSPSDGPDGGAPGGPGGGQDDGGSGGPDDGAGAPGGAGEPGAGNPGGGGDPGGSGDSGSGGPGAAPGGSGVPALAPGGADACTDQEIQVTPVAAPERPQRGTVVNLQIKIKNVSGRTCTRDVGADAQELYLKSGAEKIWSSDTCGTAKGVDVQSFTPGFERSYQVAWNGREASRCGEGVAAGEFAAAGTYQLFGRLSTKLSEPVKLTVVS
ncbi:hypothetical protein ABT336_21980 [Micromonospora sp. NPDC000207]|uniref:hypothetical protein n=1 Tax=Micromonospora sp. NPDC000207 TaxID=3154246 RepID=UPI00331E4FFD